jgi:hypothetical protein
MYSVLRMARPSPWRLSWRSRRRFVSNSANTAQHVEEAFAGGGAGGDRMLGSLEDGPGPQFTGPSGSSTGAPITSALSITSLHWRRPDRHPPMGYGLDPGGHLPPPLKDNWSAIDCILLALDRDLASARLRMIETGWG